MKICLSFLMMVLFSISSYAFPFTLVDKIDQTIKGDRTDVLAIYRNNKLVFEEYRNGYEKGQKHKLWSMSKSLVSLMLAKTVGQEKMKLSDSICDHIAVTELSSTNQCEITLEKILFWQSGVAWDETYLGLDASQSNVLNGLYGTGIQDFSKYYFGLDYSAQINNGWNYSTGDTHIMTYLLKKAYTPMEYAAMPWTLLFDPLGIENVTFERDKSGTYLGGSYIYMAHEDLNKVAQFVLSELKQPKELPADWMQNALKAKTDATFTLEMVEDAIAPAIPGGHWWLNKPSNPDIQAVPWENMPEDTFAAFGVFGQMMYIVPSEDLVIIRLAQDVDGGFNKKRMLKKVMEYLEEEGL